MTLSVPKVNTHSCGTVLELFDGESQGQASKTPCLSEAMLVVATRRR